MVLKVGIMWKDISDYVSGPDPVFHSFYVLWSLNDGSFNPNYVYSFCILHFYLVKAKTAGQCQTGKEVFIQYYLNIELCRNKRWAVF